jgi:hypothetical protein
MLFVVAEQIDFVCKLATKVLRLDDGDWRSWLARAVWDREVGGSSPLSPTIQDTLSLL